MKLIGVTGKAGSGKTTFSDILAQKENIGVIHVDEFLKKAKKKYFKGIMKEDKQGEKTKVNSKLKTILYKNKILFRLFMAFRAKLIEKPLGEEIKKLEQNGKKIILVDDIFLQYQKCYKDIQLVMLIERPFFERKNSLMERDAISKEEVVAYDIAHTSGNYKEKNKSKRVIKITNNKGKEELAVEAEKVYDENFAPMKNKYKVQTKDNEQAQKASERKIISREEEEK